jgi:hypothetical protein
MSMNFPNTPSTGQKFPSPPVVGQPVYTWDGQKWTTQGGAVQGKTAVYTDGSTAMSAALTLAGAPINPTDAADKAYVDSSKPVVPVIIPPGTVMAFWQASAPVGWTQVTTQNDKALRVVSGAGGVAGGSNPFSTVMAQTAVGGHTLAVGELPGGITSAAANNIVSYPGGNGGLYSPYNTTNWQGAGFTATGPTQCPISINAAAINGTNQWVGNNTISVTSNNTGGAAHNHPITMQMQYIDVILASKN